MGKALLSNYKEMIMKKFALMALILLALGLTACAQNTPTTVPTVVLDSSAPGGQDDSQGAHVSASAEVVPAQESQMGFIISAAVKELAVEEGDQVQAGQPLIVLDTPDLQYSVVAAEAALRSAQSYAQLQKYRRSILNHAGKTIYLTGPHEVQEVADAKVVQALAALEAARAALAQGTLLAPFDGTVVAINVAPGELVQPGQAVVVLADLEDLQIETTDLSERDLPRVSVGQNAAIFIEALNAEFSGKVKSISPRAETVGGDVVYKVTIGLDEQPQGLLWGMSAEVRFEE